MKVFLSALEASPEFEKIDKEILKYKNNLMSFYYIKNKIERAIKIRNKSELVLIDSGAHSFQKGKKVDWDKYTEQYAEFIKKFDKPNVTGYFEMDVDNIIGYDKVLELKSIRKSIK